MFLQIRCGSQKFDTVSEGPKINKNRANFEGSENVKNVREFFREGSRGVDFVVVVTVSEKKLRGKNFRAEGPKIFSESAVVVAVVVVVVVVYFGSQLL